MGYTGSMLYAIFIKNQSIILEVLRNTFNDDGVPNYVDKDHLQCEAPIILSNYHSVMSHDQDINKSNTNTAMAGKTENPFEDVDYELIADNIARTSYYHLGQSDLLFNVIPFDEEHSLLFIGASFAKCRGLHDFNQLIYKIVTLCGDEVLSDKYVYDTEPDENPYQDDIIVTYGNESPEDYFLLYDENENTDECQEELRIFMKTLYFFKSIQKFVCPNLEFQALIKVIETSQDVPPQLIKRYSRFNSTKTASVSDVTMEKEETVE